VNDRRVTTEQLIIDAAGELTIGRYKAAIAAYTEAFARLDSTDVDPDAWLGLARAHYGIRERAEGDRAYGRYRESHAGLAFGDATAELIRYREAVDVKQRGAIAADLACSSDPQVDPVLHDFIVEVARDRTGPRRGTGNPFWSGVAATLVRFGIAPHMDWYTDGPAPSETWLTDDVGKYLRKNRKPPPPRKQQPVFFGHIDGRH